MQTEVLSGEDFIFPGCSVGPLKRKMLYPARFAQGSEGLKGFQHDLALEIRTVGRPGGVTQWIVKKHHSRWIDGLYNV